MKLLKIISEIKARPAKPTLNQLKNIIKSKTGLYVMIVDDGDELSLVIKSHAYAFPKMWIYEDKLGWDIHTTSGQGVVTNVEGVLRSIKAFF